MSNKIYNEQQVAAIIKRAVEMESERSVSSGDFYKSSLTIQELEKIAAESGIDPELVKIAAREVDARYQAEATGISIPPTRIKENEIVSEQWLDIDPSDTLLDELVAELNYKYGTSPDDIGWWNDFFKSYAGKARVRKTHNSREWEYLDNWEMYKVRVLLQKRNNKLRIRVSKRQNYGLDWYTGSQHWWVMIPVFTVLSVIGGVMGKLLLGNIALGILAGAGISAMVAPIYKYYSTKSVEKHKKGVTETAGELCELAIQLQGETGPSHSGTSSKNRTRIEDIEISDDHDSDGEHDIDVKSKSKLRNQLK